MFQITGGCMEIFVVRLTPFFAGEQEKGACFKKKKTGPNLAFQEKRHIFTITESYWRGVWRVPGWYCAIPKHVLTSEKRGRVLEQVLVLLSVVH